MASRSAWPAGTGAGPLDRPWTRPANRRRSTTARLVRAFPLVGATVGASVFASISIFRHDRFASGGFDLGIFDQTIWGYSRLEIVHNTVKGTPNLLGDHFHPVLMALAPLYWLWDDARVLLVAQAFLIAAASLPIFYWARRRIGLGGAVSAQVGFLAFWGVLAGVMFDFHELAVAVPVISFGLYALLERRRRLFWAMFVLGCLTKEDVALTFAAMGVYAFVVQGRRQLGAAAVAAGAAWFGVTVSVIVPTIAGRPYHYWDYPGLGATPGRALLTLLERPYRGLTMLLDRPEKRTSLGKLMGAWLFLPLASPVLLVAVPQLAERFWAGNANLWSTSFQYSLPIAPVLAFAAVDGTWRLGRRGRGRSVAPVLLPLALAAGVVVTAFVVRPLGPLTHYMSAARATEIDRCLDAIPSQASVAASQHLIPHLTHRTDITPLYRRRDQEYLAADGRRGHRLLVAPPTGYRVLCRGGPVTVLARD